MFIVILPLIFESSESKSISEISVMVSPSKPFAFYENGLFKGLDVNIVENFARKFKLKIQYILANESLNEIFLTEGDLESVTNT